MKRILLPPVIHFSISFIIFYLLIVQVNFAQDCNTQAANKPSASVRFPDSYVSAVITDRKPASWNITNMKSNLAKAESWVKNILTGFAGAKLAYSNDYFLDYELGGVSPETFYKATGIKGFYQAVMRFYAYYCYDNDNKIYTEGESGSFIYVVFNNVFASALCTDVGVFTVNGKPVFRIFQKISSEGRIDFYEQRAKSNVNDNIYTSKNDIILIRNSDKPVFISITRKEYLEQMSKDIEAYKAKQNGFLTANYNLQIKQFEEEMRVYKTMDKSYTPEKEAKRRKWFNEDNNPEKLDKDLKKLESDANDAKRVITQYLGKSQEWLGRGFGNFYPYSSYTAIGVKQYFDGLDTFTESSEDLTRTEIVSLNPAYYNKTLGNDVPQLISIYLVKGSYPHMLKVAGLVKKPGALAPLEAFVNTGKSMPVETAPPIITSNYRLSFLPKLNTLEPLTVPVDMKASAIPVMPFNNPPPAKLNIETPARSPKLNQLPAQPFTAEAYKNYVQDLYAKIAAAIPPEEKKKADNYLKNKKLTQSKDISNTALATWLQNTPKASLYLYSLAAITDLSDGLAANNFSAFLIMSGLPEKSIPVLEYWNRQQPGKATILANLGNAYYRLGDMATAMNYLQQCVQKDSLNPTANKILCIMYLKKGDVKKAEEHGTRSLTTTHDQQVISILLQLNNKIKPGEIMSRLPPLPANEFPLLKRIKLPAMPSGLDEMEQFTIDLNAEKESLSKTIDAIEAKIPAETGDLLQNQAMKSFAHGISPIRVKAQYIIMDGMQTYQQEKARESDVFKYELKKLAAPYNLKCKAIDTKYNALLSKLEGGEAGDEDQIAALELAKCLAINAERAKYLAHLSPLVNGYAQRQEFISRRFYRDCANWLPIWISGGVPFPSIERDYLRDVAGILSEYKLESKMNCSASESLPKKDGILKDWEEEYCGDYKGKFGIGPAKLTLTCHSWGIEAGEGIVGDFEVNYANDGAFEDVSFELGFGAGWHLGTEQVVRIGAGASVKEFVKIGPDNITGEWGVTDAGGKGEISIEGEIGNVGGEVKVIEVTAGYNTGVNKGGIIVPIFNLK